MTFFGMNGLSFSINLVVQIGTILLFHWILTIKLRYCGAAKWGWVFFGRHVGRSWYKVYLQVSILFFYWMHIHFIGKSRATYPGFIPFPRFSYIAICCLSLLHQLDKINVEKAVEYIVRCKNLDGGFGCTPGGESHAGQSMLVQFDTLWNLLVIYVALLVIFMSVKLVFCHFFSPLCMRSTILVLTVCLVSIISSLSVVITL